MKNYIILLFLLFINLFFGQDLAKSLNLKLPENASVFQIIEKDKVNLFFNGNEKLKMVQLDTSFNLLDSLTIVSPEKKFEKIIGYSKVDDTYIIYWSKNNKDLLAQSLNLKTKKSELVEFQLNLEKEKILCQTTINDKFYTVTITNNSSVLNFLEISNNQVKRKTCDLSSYNFGYDKKNLNLYTIFQMDYGTQKSFNLEVIKNEIPTSLVLSSKKQKLYIFENKICISIDYHFDFTDLITINLNDFNSNIVRIKSTELKKTFDATSFLTPNYLIQSKLNSKKIMIEIKDSNFNIIKTLTINDNEEIPFKNSDIIQETGKIKNTRILDKSNQLIRKITGGYYSISCFEKSDDIIITIGGVTHANHNSNILTISGLIGGFSGVLIAAIIVGNMPLNNINSYANRKVVYINCLFDRNFNHLEGEVQKTALDKVRLFSENNLIYDSKTIFNLNNAIYFCGKIGKSNYDIIKFVND